jgi:hypothetical protein
VWHSSQKSAYRALNSAKNWFDDLSYSATGGEQTKSNFVLAASTVEVSICVRCPKVVIYAKPFTVFTVRRDEEISLIHHRLSTMADSAQMSAEHDEIVFRGKDTDTPTSPTPPTTSAQPVARTRADVCGHYWQPLPCPRPDMAWVTQHCVNCALTQRWKIDMPAVS